jgi:hypothetical protein
MRFHPDEEMMDVETIAHERSGSFLYTGCYRARGELSRADRAAWGLREPFARQLEHHLIATPLRAGTSPLMMMRPQDRGRLAVVAARPRCGSPRRADESGCQRAGPWDAASMPKRRWRFLVPARTGLQPAYRWSRLKLKVEGAPATCLVVGERAFVTGAIAIGRQGCA